MKRIFISTVIIAAIVVAVYAYVNRPVSAPSDQSLETAPEGPSLPPNPAGTDSPQEVNFTKTGNLAYDMPGKKPKTWYLVYEAPGAPALTKEIVFTEQTTCEFEDGTQACSESSPIEKNLAGLRAEVKGNEQSGVVTLTAVRIIR